MSLIERYGRFQASRPLSVEAARARRRDAAIIFYAGLNGSGKSMCAVEDTLPDLEAGRTVLSTVRFNHPDLIPCEDGADCLSSRHGAPDHYAAHPNYVPWRTWRQLLELRDGIALADEVTGVADSSTAVLPPLVIDELSQLRRVDVVLRLTGLNYIRAHKRIREATQAVVQCAGSMPQDAFHDDGRPRLHRRRRLVEWSTYDAKEIPIEAPTEAAFEDAEVLDRVRRWVPDVPARLAYDTFDSVSRIGGVSDSGRCAICEGRRTAPECDCPDYKERKGARGSARRRASVEDAPPHAHPDAVPDSTRPLHALPDVSRAGLAH